MNRQQMEYFIAAANTLSFRVSAERLFISQPALSKQIATIEKELNMQLFVRGKRGLRLTPAGEVLKNELPGYLERYNEILEKASAAFKGYRGSLNISILDGHITENNLLDTIRRFKGTFPNVTVDLTRQSFRSIREGISAQTIDIGVSLDFDIPKDAGFETYQLGTSRALLALHSGNPLARKEHLSLSDLKEELFIVPEDTDSGMGKLEKDCKECGFYPNIKKAKSLHAAMLEVEAGFGICIVNDSNSIKQNPDIVLKDVPELQNTEIVLVWESANENILLPYFIESVKESI